MNDKDMVDYFVAETNKKFDRIDQKLDKLYAFKWQIVGGAGVLSVVVSLMIAFLVKGK